MASVVRKIAGTDARENIYGVSRPDMRSSNSPYRDEIFDFNMKLLALPSQLTDLNATFTRASTATVVQNGTIVSLASGQFGTDQDVDGMYDYVAEPAATNLLTYSEQFDNAAWVPTAVTVTANATTAPDGASTADKMIPAVSLGQHRVNYTTTSAAVAHTFSVFLKAAGYNYAYLRIGATNGVFVDLTGANQIGAVGTISNPLQTALGNGWYRCSFTATAALNDIVRVNAQEVFGASNFTGDGTSGIYVWGAQLETGSRATSYIPTAAATATRAASVLSVPLANIPGFTSAQYTLFASYRMDTVFSDGASRRAISIDDETNNNIAQLSMCDNGAYGLIRSSAADQANVLSKAAMGVTRHKSSMSCAVNAEFSASDGVAGGSDASVTMPLTPTTLNIGCTYGSAAQLNGRIRRAGIITRALTQAQINGLTA